MLNLSYISTASPIARLYLAGVLTGTDIPMTEIDSTGEYLAPVPPGTAAGEYLVIFFDGPAKLASGLLFWDGEKEATPLNLEVEATVDLTEVLDAVGTPLQAGDYTAPDNQSIASINAKVDTLENTDVSALATQASVDAIGVPLQAQDYTDPPTAEQIAAQVELAILNDDDGRAVLQAIADKVTAENVTATVIAETVRQELAPELAEISQSAADLDEVKGQGFAANQHSLVKIRQHVTNASQF